MMKGYGVALWKLFLGAYVFGSFEGTLKMKIVRHSDWAVGEPNNDELNLQPQWLHNPRRLGRFRRFRLNRKWPTSGPSGCITPDAWGV